MGGGKWLVLLPGLMNTARGAIDRQRVRCSSALQQRGEDSTVRTFFPCSTVLIFLSKLLIVCVVAVPFS